MESAFSIDFESRENEDPEMLEQFQASDIIDQISFRGKVNVLKTPNRHSEPICDIRSSETALDPSLYMASPDGSLIMIRKANNGRMSPVMGMSVKDYEEKMKSLRQENFDLRLYSYNLEQRLKDDTRSQSEFTMKRYTVQLETEQAKLLTQLAEKNELLKSASAAIESLKSENDAARRDLDLANSASQQLAELRVKMEQMEKERTALRRELEEARFKLAEAKFSREQTPARPTRESEQGAGLDDSDSVLRDKLVQADSRVTELTQHLSQFEDDHLDTTQSPKVRELEQEMSGLNQKYERSVKAIQSFIRKVSKRDKEISRLHTKIDDLTTRLKSAPAPTEQPLVPCCCQATQHPPSDLQEPSDTASEDAQLALQRQIQELKQRLTEAERRHSLTTEESSLQEGGPGAPTEEMQLLRQQLKQAEEEAAQLRARSRRLQELLDERTGALTMAHSDAAAKAEAVQEKYRHLVEGLEARLEHKELQLQQLVDSLATRDQVLLESLGAEAATAESLCRQLEEKEQQLGELLDAKSSITADLAAARRELTRRAEAEKQASRKSLQSAQHECHRLQQELAASEATVQRLQAEVQGTREARRVTEDQSRRHVEERDVLIRKLQGTITEQEEQVAVLTKAAVGPSPALCSFEAMVMEKTARLEESLALREKALQDALHEYRCLTSALTEKEAELDRVREEGEAAVADLRAMIHSLECQVEDAEFELSHLRELLHRSEESHVDRLERASMLLEARDRTIDGLLADTRRQSPSRRVDAASESRNPIVIDDLSVSPGAKPDIADMSVSSLHSEVARLRGLLTEKEELLERYEAPPKGMARRLLTLRRHLTTEAAVAPQDTSCEGSPGGSLTTNQLQALQSQIRSLLQTLERTQHLQESFFGDLLTTANESLLQPTQLRQPKADSPGRETACETSICLGTPSRFADQSVGSLSGVSFFLSRLPRTPGGNVTLPSEGVTLTEEMHEVIFERLREQVEQLRGALAACSEQGLALMQEAALCASVGPQQLVIDAEDWTALLRRLLVRLEREEEGEAENEAVHRDVRIAVGLCRQIVERLDRQAPTDHRDLPEARSLTASQLKSTYNPKVSGSFSLSPLSPFNLDDSELEPEDLSKTLNLARTRCAALESQLRAIREQARSLEAENKVLRLRLSTRSRQDGASGFEMPSPEAPLSGAKTTTDSGHVDDIGSPVANFNFSRSPFRTQRGSERDTLLIQDIVDLERERSALESELSRARDLCASGNDDPQRSLLDSRVEEVTEQLRTMRLDLSLRLQDQSCLHDSDLGSRASTSLGSRARASLASRSPATPGKECAELRKLVVDLRRQLAERPEVADITQRLTMMSRDLELERDRVEELVRERDRLLLDRAEGTRSKEQLQHDLEAAHEANAQLRGDLAELGEQFRMRESTDADRVAIEQRIVSIRSQMGELETENAAVRKRAEEAEAEAERKQAEAARLSRACAALTEEAECLKQRLTELAEAEAERSERLAAKTADEQRLTIALVNAEDEVEGLRQEKSRLERRLISFESALKAGSQEKERLEEALAGACEDRARLTAVLEAAEEERTRLGALVESRTKEGEGVRAERAKLAEERSRLSAALSDTSEEKTRLTSELERVSEERMQLHAQLKQVNEQHAVVSEEKAHLVSQLKELSEKQAVVTEERTQLVSQLKELSEKQAVVTEEKAQLVSELKELSEQQAVASEEKTHLVSELKQLSEKHAVASEERAQLVSELKQLSEEHAIANEARHEVMQRLEEKAVCVRALEEEVRRVGAVLEEQEARLSAMKEEKGASDARLVEVESKWKLAKEVIQQIEEQVRALEVENEQLTTRLNQLEAELRALEQEKEELVRLKEEHTVGNRELQAENSSLKYKVQELQETLNGWREAMDELERRLADRSASIDRLSSQYSELTHLRDAAEQRSAALEGEVECLRSSRGDLDVTQEENRLLHVAKAELERRLQTMSEVLRQREETIEEVKKESATYHSQVQRFSPEIRSLQFNLASVNSHRSEMRACLERLHARIRSSVAEHKARLSARGIETDRDSSTGSMLEETRSEEALDLPVVETELHRALDKVHSLQEALERLQARVTAKDAALRDLAGDLEEARARSGAAERAKERAEEQEQWLRARLEQSRSALTEAEDRREREALPSAAELRETGEMIRALEGRVRDLLTEKDKWKAAAKELRAKLDTRSSRLEACVKQNARLKALIKQDEQQAEDRRLDLEKLTISVEGKNDTIARLQRQLKSMQRELEASRPRAVGQNNSNIHASDACDPSDQSEQSEVLPPTNGSFSIASRSSTSSTVTSVQSSRESVRASAATPTGPLAPLTPALSDVTGSSLAPSSGRGEKRIELLSLQTKLRATESLNKSLRAELSLAEQHIEAIKSSRTSLAELPAAHSHHTSPSDSVTLSASASPFTNVSLDQFLRTYVEEIRSLRSCLETSIAENDRLRESLRKQLLEQQDSQKSPSQFEKEFRRLRDRLTSKKRRLVELQAELAGVRARTESSERENVVLRSELQATKDMLATCQTELDLLSAKKSPGGRREMLRETQRLRVQLERSLESNRRLHDQLKQQLASATGRGDFSNCSTPKSVLLAGGSDDVTIELSAVAGDTPARREPGSRSRSANSRRTSARSTLSCFSTSPDPLRVDSDFRLLYAISRLDDYELLRKEIQETLCLVRSIRSRVDDRVRHYKSEPLNVRSQSLDYSTWKELQSEVNSLVYFLEDENGLIGRFWTAELPPGKQRTRYEDTSAHVQHMETQLEVERLRSSNRLLRQLLDRNEKRLVETDRAKSDMESVLVERLSSTKHVLSAARGSLERSTSSSALYKTN